MIERTLFRRATRTAAFFAIVALLATLALPALASVTLTTFEAAVQADNASIRIFWAAATELETASYNLYRAETQAPDNWGAPICQKAAAGSVAPASYECFDTLVTAGVTYYYKLEDISVSGQQTAHGPVSARIMLPGEDATNTPTATATWTGVPTATMGYVPVANPTATATQPPPTATRRYTNTPVVSPLGTPILSAPTAAPLVVGRATVTRLPGAAVATPTRSALLQPAVPVAPVTMPPEETIEPMAQQPTFAPTVAVVAQAPAAGLATATDLPARKVTPIVFAAAETREVGATESVASQGGRDMGGVLAIAGGALGLAGVLTAVYLFLRSSRKV